MTLRATCESALANANVQAFLRVIRQGESSQDDNAYRTLFGGDLFDGWQHPNKVISRNGYNSTAAGAYQFISQTWSECARALDLPDFSPHSQDLAAVYLIHRRGALDEVMAGSLDEAIRLCNREWASLPGSPYGQPTMTLDRAKAVYKAYGGVLAGEAVAPATGIPQEIPVDTQPKPERKKMPIFLSALLQLIPGLITVFGKDSERAKANAQTFNVVSDAVVKAVPGATDLPTAISAMVADPAVKAKAEAEVMQSPAVLALVEVGGGVIEARKSAADPLQVPFYKNPAFLLTLVMLPMPYYVVIRVLDSASNVSAEVQSGVIMAVISGVLSAITGFWLGTSFGSSRKTEIIANR